MHASLYTSKRQAYPYNSEEHAAKDVVWARFDLRSDESWKRENDFMYTAGRVPKLEKEATSRLSKWMLSYLQTSFLTASDFATPSSF